MAALTPNQYIKVWGDGLSDHVAVYVLRKVSTGDTADLSSDFSDVRRAVVLGTTVAGAASATVSGVTATMPAGMTNDAAVMTAYGVSA